jgi:hypothetical protein
MSKIPSKEQILERVVKNLQKDKAHVMRKGKSIIPECVDDLPPNMRVASHREYTRAYSNLYCSMNYKPISTPVVAKRKAKMKVKTPTKVAPTPLMLAETPKPSPMKGYKQVARTGRVNETTAKKLVVNLSPTMTCTIQDNGLITVDFK